MALNNLLTNHDVLMINDAGIVTAALGIAIPVGILGSLTWRLRKDSGLLREHLKPMPTRILYVALLVSLVYSACFIVTCSSLASNHVACKISMWGLITTVHIMNGFCTTILLHCSLLLSSRNAASSSLIVRISVALIVFFSLALGTAGLVAGRFGYLEDQDSCWMVPADKGLSRYSAYKMECILLYGPLFAMLLLSFIALAYIWYCINHLRLSHEVNLNKTRSLVLRLCFPPGFLSVHCLMIIGGDLPITYGSRAGQYASYFLNYVGLASFGLALGLCAIFLDPAYNNVHRIAKQQTRTTRTSEGETEEIQEVVVVVVVSSPRPDDKLDDDKSDTFDHASTLNIPRTIFELEKHDEEMVVESEISQHLVSETMTTRREEHHDDDEAVSFMPIRKKPGHICTPDGDCCIFDV